MPIYDAFAPWRKPDFGPAVVARLFKPSHSTHPALRVESCPWCGKAHYHSLIGPQHQLGGPRNAHCHDARFGSQGYTLELDERDVPRLRRLLERLLQQAAPMPWRTRQPLPELVRDYAALLGNFGK